MKARSSASSPSFASSETGLSVASCITLRCAINDRCINMHSAAARRNLVRRRSFPCRLNSRARDTRPWRCIHRMHLNQEIVCILDAWRAINRRSPTTGAQRLIRRIAASASGESREHHKIPNSQVRIQNERLMRLGLGKKKKERNTHLSFHEEMRSTCDSTSTLIKMFRGIYFSRERNVCAQDPVMHKIREIGKRNNIKLAN